MKKFITMLLCVIFIGFLLFPVITVQGAENESMLIEAHATAYKQTGTMRWGQYTRLGACAGAEAYKNCVIMVYQRNPDDSLGDFIGIYECLDTGGTDGLKNGTVVDIWRPDLESCQDFMDLVYTNGCQGNVYIQVIEGKG